MSPQRRAKIVDACRQGYAIVVEPWEMAHVVSDLAAELERRGGKMIWNPQA